MTTDAELVILARAGDIASLGSLLERYRPRMLATAYAILGPGPDAHDAVQEGCILALGRIGQVRTPDAVGSWLVAIVRHAALNARRSPWTTATTTLDAETSPEPQPPDRISMDEALDQLATRDWVWSAISTLPESLQVTVMLRYFGDHSSYAEIASILSVPIGTVRSRLNDARTRLATSLTATAEAVHDDTRAISWAFQQQFTTFVDQYNHGVVDPGKIATYAPGINGIIGTTSFLGRNALERELHADTYAGVKLHPRTMLASPHVAVCEATWENPPEDPFHCPPGMAYIEFIRDDIVQSIRVYHAPRPHTPRDVA